MIDWQTIGFTAAPMPENPGIYTLVETFALGVENSAFSASSDLGCRS